MRLLIQAIVSAHNNTLSAGALCQVRKRRKEGKVLPFGGALRLTVLPDLRTLPSSVLFCSWLLREPCNQVVTKLCLSVISSSRIIVAARPLCGENRQARLGRPTATQVCMAHPPFIRINSFTGQGMSIHLFWALPLLCPVSLWTIYHGAGGRRCGQKSSFVSTWCEGDG